jgi:hypothetical protein
MKLPIAAELQGITINKYCINVSIWKKSARICVIRSICVLSFFDGNGSFAPGGCVGLMTSAERHILFAFL